MINICTLSDSNYLFYGLTLYESLKETTSNFKLHYLCLCEKSFNKIKELNLPEIEPYFIDDLVQKDDDFFVLKTKTKPELGGGNRNDFIWSLASFFSYYLLNEKEIDISYVDSDIYFYHDYNTILNKMEDKDVCMFRHKHVVSSNNPDGLFNVGVMVFKNTDIGKKALKWWRDAVFTKTPKHLATCGDQKFLEGIFNIIPQEQIYVGDKDISHGAPWHYRFLNFDFFEKEKNVIWGDKKQPFVFNHFSKFTPNFEKRTFEYTGPHYMDHTYNNLLFNDYHLKKLYVDYFNKCSYIKSKYNI